VSSRAARILVSIAATVVLSGCDLGFADQLRAESPILTGDDARAVCRGRTYYLGGEYLPVGPEWTGTATNNGTEDNPEWTCTGLNPGDLFQGLPNRDLPDFSLD